MFELVETNVIQVKMESLLLYFLDLSKAFDTVNHDVLLSKLSKFNFSSRVLAWMSSYLSNRMQCVKVCDALSNIMCTMFHKDQC